MSERSRADLEALVSRTFPAAQGDQLDLEKRRIAMGTYDALFAASRARVLLSFIPPNLWIELNRPDDPLPRDVEWQAETALKAALIRTDETRRHIQDTLIRIAQTRDELWLRETQKPKTP